MAKEFFTKVVGVTQENEEDGKNRQTLIRELVNPFSEIELIPEPDNPHDPNAIAVHVYPDDYQDLEGPYKIGYLSAGVAEMLCSQMENGIVASAFVTNVTGGGEGESYGVNLQIVLETEAEAQKKIQRFKERIARQPAPVAAEKPKKKPTIWVILALIITVALFSFCLCIAIGALNQ